MVRASVEGRSRAPPRARARARRSNPSINQERKRTNAQHHHSRHLPSAHAPPPRTKKTKQPAAAAAAAPTSARAAAAAAATSATAGVSPFTAALADLLRRDTPVLTQTLPGSGKPLVYLDSAATSQKPLLVTRAMDDYYARYNANVHRGVHELAAAATAAYEGARAKVAALINARGPDEVVWTRNASEAVNLVAFTWGLANLKPGDEIVVSVAEHHSNLVPWQMVAKRTGAVLRHVRLRQQGGGGGAPSSSSSSASASAVTSRRRGLDHQTLDMDHYDALLSPRTKLVALPHVSNVLGCVLDAERVVSGARRVGARVLLDACQSVPHMPVDVQALGADWIVASGHKMLAPTGVGFLWGRREILASEEEMPPWMGGGEMIRDVFLDHSTYAGPPAKFEAGTPAIAEAIGLGAAVDLLMSVGSGGGAAEAAGGGSGSSSSGSNGHGHGGGHGHGSDGALPSLSPPLLAPPSSASALADYAALRADAGMRGMRAVHQAEQELGGYLWERLARLDRVELYGPPPETPGGRAALAAFNVRGLHATDVSTLLDASGVAVRSGHHCAQPLHRELGVPASARASLHVYNTAHEVDVFVDALQETIAFFDSVGGGEGGDGLLL
jgi:cysteine desulfurase/selenocysteine lyase